MNCIVCDDNLDMHNNHDILDCWKEIADITYFRGDIKTVQLKAWLAGPTAKILAGERAHIELAQTYYGPKKTREELLTIIEKARSQT